MVEDLANDLESSSCLVSSALGRVTGEGTESFEKEGRFNSVLARARDPSASGGLRGVPGFSERRKDGSEVPSYVV